MEYFNIFFLNSISSLIIILNGISFKKLLGFKHHEENNFESGLYGIILISIITFITNFFFKISHNVSVIILIAPIIFIIKDILPLKNKVFFHSILIGLISSIIMYFDNTNRPDAGLYHLPFINIINDSKIIIGSANLEFRFGHTSILQYLSAAFNNNIFSENGILLPLANTFSFVILYLISLIKNNTGLLKIIFFIFLFNILYSMNRYSGLGNDDPGHMYYYLVLCNLIYCFFENSKNELKKNVVIFSLFAFLIKPFLILVFLFPLILIIQKKIKVFSKINFFCLIIIVFWSIKNILISSCAFYPVSITCLKNVEWTTLNSRVSNPERVSRTSEAWAKDWPNKKKEISQKEYVKKFNWISTWKNNHFKIFLVEIFPQIILLMSLIIIGTNSVREIKIHKLKILLLAITFISSLIWFTKFPIYRYGQAYIISFINLIFLNLLSFNFKMITLQKDKIYKFVNIILIICIFGVTGKNLLRIYSNKDNTYFNYPWPKMYSYTETNNKNKNIEIKSEDGNFLYYKPYPYSLCMFSKSPCTSNADVGKIYKKVKLGYKIYHY